MKTRVCAPTTSHAPSKARCLGVDAIDLYCQHDYVKSPGVRSRSSPP
jgi:hypothetical protein